MNAIGLLHPGEMGASIGEALLSSGHDVVWCSAGRSAATTEPSETALTEILSRSERG